MPQNDDLMQFSVYYLKKNIAAKQRDIPQYLHLLREVEVDDHVDVLDIETARSDIRSHQDQGPPFLEVVQDAVTLALGKKRHINQRAT